MADPAYEAFVQFMNREWPLWRQHSDTGLAHKLRRAFIAGRGSLTDAEIHAEEKRRNPPPPNPQAPTMKESDRG